MIYYRSTAPEGTVSSLSTLRTLIAGALLAYPVGCVLLELSNYQSKPSAVMHLIGFGLVFIALFSAAPVVGSRLQRIVAEQPSKLDEMELQQRHKAMNGAYMTFTALFLAAIAYVGAASDMGLWVPAGYENWNALFWGVLLYSTLLPTAFLAWTMPEDRD